ncbi:hypothetical protein CY0110_17982 [Crocosphaera chwakensis CCY0110]|uniref:Uncharacterized protein n=1 Tax=Crocosphaera chwakensis CCY0110 TaxID=391612 RepID=A3IIS8_9CHRO|nr:hypothetical protein CY0110_17982 [Crocosphaera chwakensis CCY0110]
MPVSNRNYISRNVSGYVPCLGFNDGQCGHTTTTEGITEFSSPF